MFCFEAASEPKPATISMISQESASMVSKSSKIDDQKLKELGREQSRTRRRLQAFSRKIFPRRASKAKSGQKIPECRRARARCSNPNFEAEGETPSWRDFQNCAALQDSAAKTARVSCQARPLPHCPAYAHRGVLWQPCKHQNMKQAKRLQLATENAVVAAGCDY